MAIWRPSPRQLFGHFGHWGHFKHTLLFLAGKGYCFQAFFWNSSFLVFLLFSCALFPEFFGPLLGNHWHFFGHPQNITQPSEIFPQKKKHACRSCQNVGENVKNGMPDFTFLATVSEQSPHAWNLCPEAAKM